jgi:hypothetical protein
MKSLIIAGAALALGIGGANAAGDGGRVSARYSVGTGQAHIGGGAHIGDGSDPGYFAPGYSGGTGAARIGDGSDPGYLDTQRYLQSAPGRGGGEG